uniref:Uncharacterized protein n=1 Tax=Romanomermis culicivorax TaxID=13658 RepID=A0A915HW86_ROMCU
MDKEMEIMFVGGRTINYEQMDIIDSHFNSAIFFAFSSIDPCDSRGTGEGDLFPSTKESVGIDLTICCMGIEVYKKLSGQNMMSFVITKRLN